MNTPLSPPTDVMRVSPACFSVKRKSFKGTVSLVVVLLLVVVPRVINK